MMPPKVHSIEVSLVELNAIWRFHQQHRILVTHEFLSDYSFPQMLKSLLLNTFVHWSLHQRIFKMLHWMSQQTDCSLVLYALFWCTIKDARLATTAVKMDIKLDSCLTFTIFRFGINKVLLLPSSFLRKVNLLKKVLAFLTKLSRYP